MERTIGVRVPYSVQRTKEVLVHISRVVRTVLVCLSSVVASQCTPAVPQLSSDMLHRRMWATAVQEFDFQTGVRAFRDLVVPAAVIFAGDHIVIETLEPQRYILISEATVEDNLWGWSMTWSAIDGRGRPASIMFGILRQQNDIQLRIKYWDYKMVYQLRRDGP